MVSVKLKNISQHNADRLNETNNSAKQYNDVFRQASNNLIVVAGTLLAFSTVFVTQLSASSFILKLLIMVIVVCLSGSLAFGIIQQLIESQYFRTNALSRIKLTKKIQIEGIENNDTIEGMINQLDDQRGYSVTRWASYVQLCLLASALILVIIAVFIYLFN